MRKSMISLPCHTIPLSLIHIFDGAPAPYAGRIPVFLVMADQAGGLAGNYHGTTVVAQTLRGLWPEWTQKAEDAGIYRVVSVPINDAEGFRQAIEAWNTPPYKTAGFCDIRFYPFRQKYF